MDSFLVARCWFLVIGFWLSVLGMKSGRSASFGWIPVYSGGYPNLADNRFFRLRLTEWPIQRQSQTHRPRTKVRKPCLATLDLPTRSCGARRGEANYRSVCVRLMRPHSKFTLQKNQIRAGAFIDVFEYSLTRFYGPSRHASCNPTCGRFSLWTNCVFG